VNGEQAGAYTYLMEFPARRELDDNVVLQHHDDLPVAIPANSAELLQGATLEFNGGMVMQNPNRPIPASPVMADRPPADLSGDCPSASSRCWSSRSYPAIASTAVTPSSSRSRTHRVLALFGGLPGCGMASVTLEPGIEWRSSTPSGDHRGDRRDRPRHRFEPVLRGRQK